jgi:hypothetical protein
MRKARLSRWFLAAAVLVELCAGDPRVALGDQPTSENVVRARELFTAATEQRDAGDAKGALSKFEAAHMLVQNPITAVELGRTYLLVNMLVEARATFDSVARMPVQPDETTRSKQARVDAAQLAADVEARIPTVTVKIREATPSVTIALDRAAVPVVVGAGPFALNPGTHKLVATTSIGSRAETNVAVTPGESREVELSVATVSNARAPTKETTAHVASRQAPSPLQSTPSQSTPSQSTPSQSTPAPVVVSSGGVAPLAYAGFGVGAAGFVVGGVAGALAIQKVSGLQTSCQSTACIPAVNDQLQSARTLGYVATVALVAAGAGVAAGIAGLLMGDTTSRATTGAPAPVGAWAGLGIGGIQGSF